MDRIVRWLIGIAIIMIIAAWAVASTTRVPPPRPDPTEIAARKAAAALRAREAMERAEWDASYEAAFGECIAGADVLPRRYYKEMSEACRKRAYVTMKPTPSKAAEMERQALAYQVEIDAKNAALAAARVDESSDEALPP